MTRLILALLLACPLPALAQPARCGPRDAVVRDLTGSYGETLQGGGLRTADTIVEVWASETAGTWTVLITGADGRSCIMASGTYWHGKAQRPAGVPG